MFWMRRRSDSAPKLTIWHNGGTNGYRSYLGFTPDGRFGVVVLANTAQEVDSLGERILRELAEAPSAPAPRE
jgi:hypothetical protein